MMIASSSSTTPVMGSMIVFLLIVSCLDTIISSFSSSSPSSTAVVAAATVAVGTSQNVYGNEVAVGTSQNVYGNEVAVGTSQNVYGNEVAVGTSQNVYGKELESCSRAGMALTGFTRNGHCIEEIDDEGSHHICINLISTEGGNFCAVTGQPDWCSSSMPCDGKNIMNGDNENIECHVQNWCVCQWAFSSYIEKAGGCDQIQDIVCEAINMEAITAYKNSDDSNHKIALECITARCHL